MLVSSEHRPRLRTAARWARRVKARPNGRRRIASFHKRQRGFEVEVNALGVTFGDAAAMDSLRKLVSSRDARRDRAATH